MDRAVSTFRSWIRGHLGIAAMIVVVALALRILVPAGFMPVAGNGTITVGLCNSAVSQIVIEIPGLKHQPDGEKASGGCAFSDLSLPSLGGVDAIQLATLIAYLVAAGIACVVVQSYRAIDRLRPPLRGPPATS